ncbi:MAG: hypothetical protein HND55_04185 [Pseudomonadota bacterium]|nr:MAG: hypothetical protein HND55_04185 [Pseudomonadota bacterium]
MKVSLASSTVPESAAARPGAEPSEDCCSCQVTDTVALQAPPMLPCLFNIPAGWDARFGNDGALISAVIGAQCGAACPVGPAQSFSVAVRGNRNAEAMEEIWSGLLTVVGKAECGNRTVTFFEPPGSDPNGQLGSLQFHIGFGDRLYSANALFTCPVPGQWQTLRDRFIESFRSNPNSTFGQD